MKRKEMLMKNEILKQLANRKSVRVFEDREIPKEDKAAIITAAAMAPTPTDRLISLEKSE